MSSPGQKHLKEAEKLQRKPWYASSSWVPDWDSVATQFEDAARELDQAGEKESAMRTYAKAGWALSQTETPAAGGKAYTHAARLASHLHDRKASSDYLVLASRAYLAGGHISMAADMLQRAGAAAEDVELLWEAVDMQRDEGKRFAAVEVLKMITDLSLRSGDLDEATKSLRTTVATAPKDSLAYSQSYLSLIALYLLTRDEVAAFNLLERYEGKHPDYVHVASELAHGFREGDQERLAAARKHPVVGFLDNQVGRLVMSLNAPGSSGGLDHSIIASNTAPRPGMATAEGGPHRYGGGAGYDEDEDDEFL